MPKITKQGTIDFTISLKEYIARAMSKWSLEFSVFMGLVITLYEMDLVDILLLKIFLTIALVGFFLAVMLKFGIAVYKDSAHGIIEISKCIKDSKKTPGPELPEPVKTPENYVREAVKSITENFPLIEESNMPIDPEPEFTEELRETIEETYAEPEPIEEPKEPEYLPGTEPD